MRTYSTTSCAAADGPHRFHTTADPVERDLPSQIALIPWFFLCFHSWPDPCEAEDRRSQQGSAVHANPSPMCVSVECMFIFCGHITLVSF